MRKCRTSDFFSLPASSFYSRSDPLVGFVITAAVLCVLILFILFCCFSIFLLPLCYCLRCSLASSHLRPLLLQLVKDIWWSSSVLPVLLPDCIEICVRACLLECFYTVCSLPTQLSAVTACSPSLRGSLEELPFVSSFVCKQELVLSSLYCQAVPAWRKVLKCIIRFDIY